MAGGASGPRRAVAPRNGVARRATGPEETQLKVTADHGGASPGDAGTVGGIAEGPQTPAPAGSRPVKAAATRAEQRGQTAHAAERGHGHASSHDQEERMKPDQMTRTLA